MRKKIVMQDIADKLNISKNSVSQALSGKAGVSEETRRKIIQTAEEMGYRYTRKKSNPANNQVKSIGLIASEQAFSLKSFFGEIYLSIEREAQRHGIRLVIQSITPHDKDQFRLPDFVKERNVDGILILSHMSTAYINKIIAQGIPTVLVDHHHPEIEADAVLPNNRFGAYTAVKHLLDLGHDRIAVIGNVQKSASYQERLEGYMLAMNEHGAEIDDQHIFTDVQEDEQSIEQLLSSLQHIPKAWFCLSDGYGFFVNAGLKKMGYRIPEDVSICGFDNNYFSQVSDPKMTTMDIDLSLFANKALAQLLWRIQNPDEVNIEIVLPTKLIKRNSTATVKRSE